VTKARRILISASLFHALNDSATVAVPMIFPLLLGQRWLIRDYGEIGLLSNFGLLTTCLFQVLIVHAAKRWDYRLMLGVSLAGISASLVLISLASSYASLFLIYLLFRVFDSFYHTIGLAWVSRSHPSQGIDLAMGVQSGSGNLGVFLAFISVGFLAQRFDWRVPLWSWAGVCLGLGLASFILVRRISFETDGVDGLNLSSWFETFRVIRRYVGGFVFGGAAWSVTIYFAPSLLNRKFGVPMGRTGLYLALWIGIGTVMSYFFGGLSRALGRKLIFRAALAGGSLSLIVVGLAQRPWLAVLGLVTFGLFLFLIYPALQSCVGNIIAPKNQSQAFSVVSNLQIVSGALIALAAGFLSDRFGVNSPFLVMGGLGLFILFGFSSRISPEAPSNGC
jgi:MFS family permease